MRTIQRMGWLAAVLVALGGAWAQTPTYMVVDNQNIIATDGNPLDLTGYTPDAAEGVSFVILHITGTGEVELAQNARVYTSTSNRILIDAATGSTLGGQLIIHHPLNDAGTGLSTEDLLGMVVLQGRQITTSGEWDGDRGGEVVVTGNADFDDITMRQEGRGGLATFRGGVRTFQNLDTGAAGLQLQAGNNTFTENVHVGFSMSNFDPAYYGATTIAGGVHTFQKDLETLGGLHLSGNATTVIEGDLWYGLVVNPDYFTVPPAFTAADTANLTVNGAITGAGKAQFTGDARVLFNGEVAISGGIYTHGNASLTAKANVTGGGIYNHTSEGTAIFEADLTLGDALGVGKGLVEVHGKADVDSIDANGTARIVFHDQVTANGTWKREAYFPVFYQDLSVSDDDRSVTVTMDAAIEFNAGIVAANGITVGSGSVRFADLADAAGADLDVGRDYVPENFWTKWGYQEILAEDTQVANFGELTPDEIREYEENIAARAAAIKEVQAGAPAPVVTFAQGAAFNGRAVHIGRDGLVLLEGDATFTLQPGGGLRVEEGGTLAPGLNTLTVAGGADTVFASGSIYEITVAENDSSLVATDGHVVIEEGAVAHFTGVLPLRAIGVEVITAASVEGRFDLDGGIFSLGYSDNSVHIVAVEKARTVLGPVIGDRFDGDVGKALDLVDSSLYDGNADPDRQIGLVEWLHTASQLDEKDALAAARGIGAMNVATAVGLTRDFLTAGAGSLHRRQQYLRGPLVAPDIAQRYSHGDRDLFRVSEAWGRPIDPRDFPSVANEYPNGFWVDGLQTWRHQKADDGFEGQKMRMSGLIAGYDRTFGSSAFGLYGAYGMGRTETDDHYSRVDNHVWQVGLYGQWRIGDWFVQGDLGGGQGRNKMNSRYYAREVVDRLDGTTDTAIVRETAHGKFHQTFYNASVETGFTHRLSQSWRLTPTIGLRYQRLSQSSFRESDAVVYRRGHEESDGAGEISVVADSEAVVARRFAGKTYDEVTLPVKVVVAGDFLTPNDWVVTPEVSLGAVFSLTDPDTRLRSGFVGMAPTDEFRGLGEGRVRGQLGAGVSVFFMPEASAYFRYDLDVGSKLYRHTLSAGMGLAF